MYSPRTHFTFVATILMLVSVTVDANAQNSASAQFQARMAAMQQAQLRGQAVRVASQAPVRLAKAQGSSTRMPLPLESISGQAAPLVQSIAPTQTLSAPLITQGTVIDGGIPMGQSVLSNPVVSDGYITSVPGQPVGTPVIHSHVDSGVVLGDEVVLDACNTCGDSGQYFVDDCCGRGGCPDGTCPNGVPCWFGPLGKAFRNGSYFFGATAFRHPAFTNPTGGTDLIQDSNFGAYGGFNLGIPLCRLFCGQISGQFGIRSVQTNFSGNEFTGSSRDQTFFTAGLYRRVDYGLQAGLVVDVLAEQFFTESDVAQLRGEVSWAYTNGGAFGFRFTSSQENDSTDGVFDGTSFSNFATTTDDHYRFFLRKIVATGGFEEIYLGWAENDRFAVGADFDIPVSQYFAIQAGAVLYLSDLQDTTSNLGTTRIDDSFNLYAGFAFRPKGAAWYRSYDRPLLPVADNGTFLIRR